MPKYSVGKLLDNCEAIEAWTTFGVLKECFLHLRVH